LRGKKEERERERERERGVRINKIGKKLGFGEPIKRKGGSYAMQ
jgi:hypothetical protein